MIFKFNYSVIIPHYNSFNLLERCVNSIPEREDIEIIIVDDNSNTEDEYYKILKNLKRKNLKLILNKENKGAGYARNMGMLKAEGKWLLFCDADDFYLDDFIFKIDVHQNSSSDIIFFNIISKYSDTLEDAIRHYAVDSLINKAISKKKNDIKRLKYSFLEPFSKLYKHEFVKINNLWFEEVFYSNDTMFTLQAALKTENIEVVPDPIYCVTVNKNSLTNTVTKNSIETRIKVIIRANILLVKFKEKKYRISVIPFIIQSQKWGVFYLLSNIKLLLYNNQNIFIGFHFYISVLFKRFSPTYRYHSKNLKKYKSE